MVRRIDHIAIAVHDIDEAAKFYRDILKLVLSGVEVVTEQKSKVGFFKINVEDLESNFIDKVKKQAPILLKKQMTD